MEIKGIKKEVTITFDETEIIALKNICKFYLDNINFSIVVPVKIAQSILTLEV